MRSYRAELFTGRNLLLKQKWYFRLVSTGNGEILAQSEGYVNYNDCLEIAEMLAGKGNWYVRK